MKKLFVVALLILLFSGLSYASPATSQPQQLVVSIAGVNVNLDWSAMPAAPSYTLYYAFADYKGDIDVNTIGSIEMGSQKSLYVPGLPSGLIIYAAILAHTASGDVLSNIAQCMGFAGTITFPETGDVVLVVDDPGGMGNFTVSGTRDARGEITAITQIAYTGATGSYLMTIKNDRPDAIIQDNVTTRFIYQADGAISFETVPNHTVSALSTMASVATGDNHLCDQYADRNAYEKALRKGGLSREEVMRKLRELHYPEIFIGLLAENSISNPAALYELTSLISKIRQRSKLELVVGYYKLVFESIEGVIEGIIEKKLAAYEQQCPNYGLYVYIPEMHENVYLGGLKCHVPLDARPLEGSSFKTYTLGNNYVGPFISWVSAARDNRATTACRDGMGTFIWLLEFNRNDDSKAYQYSHFINGKRVVNYQFYPNGNLQWSFYWSESGQLEESYKYSEDGKLLQHCDPQGCKYF